MILRRVQKSLLNDASVSLARACFIVDLALSIA